MDAAGGDAASGGRAKDAADPADAEPLAAACGFSAGVCGAAVFAAGGENEVRAKSAALSALKSLRSRFTHLEWPDCLPDDPLHDAMEPTEYTASLKELISDRRNGIGVLPDFRPEDH